MQNGHRNQSHRQSYPQDIPVNYSRSHIAGTQRRQQGIRQKDDDIAQRTILERRIKQRASRAAYTDVQQRQPRTPQQADTRNKGNCQQCHRQAIYLARSKHPVGQGLGAKGIPCIDLMFVVKIITPGIPGSVKHDDVQQCPDAVHPVYVLPHPIQICQRHHHRHRRGGE